MIEAKVTSKGQLTLPVELRDRLGIGPGDHIIFVEQADGTFALRVRSGTLTSLRGILAEKVGTAPSDEQVRTWIDEVRSRALSATKPGK